jgi:IS4 transposase
MTRIHQKISFSDALKKEYDFSIFALDSSLIRLCLNVFFWAKYRQTKSAVKIHTLLDVQSSIPYYFRITDGLVGDMSILKQLAFIPGAFYVMDRGYNDFNQLYRIHTSRAFFVLRAKSPLRFKRMYSNPKKENILVDQIGKFTVYSSKMAYPEKIRCIKSFDPESKSKIVLLTNNFEIEATDIAEFYRKRWQVELFFKWIKQHLKIKTFWGFSENAVKTQIYSALSVYLIVALLKYNLDIQQNLFEILQILSVSLLVKEPINEVFREPQLQNIQVVDPNQLKMW